MCRAHCQRQVAFFILWSPSEVPLKLLQISHDVNCSETDCKSWCSGHRESKARSEKVTYVFQEILWVEDRCHPGCI